MDESREVRRSLEQRVALPALDLAYDEEPRRLPGIAGGLSLVPARTFKILGLLDPKIKNP